MAQPRSSTVTYLSTDLIPKTKLSSKHLLGRGNIAFLLIWGMVAKFCIRCKKHSFKKGVCSIEKGYIKTFLKVENGLTDDEIQDGKLCAACRSFIYNFTFRKSATCSKSGAKRAFSESEAAADAARNVAKRACLEDDFKTAHTGQGMFFKCLY